jgi:hypothetical protein
LRDMVNGLCNHEAVHLLFPRLAAASISRAWI